MHQNINIYIYISMYANCPDNGPTVQCAEQKENKKITTKNTNQHNIDRNEYVHNKKLVNGKLIFFIIYSPNAFSLCGCVNA